MGDRDPEVARQNAPNSLRALYSISGIQNAVMGSPDDETAEIQITIVITDRVHCESPDDSTHL